MMEAKTSGSKTRRLGSILGLILVVYVIVIFVYGLFSPSLDFDIGYQGVRGDLVVSSVDSSSLLIRSSGLGEGDKIESVNGKMVSTKGEFWYQMLRSRGKVELGVERIGVQFEKLLSPSSFVAGDVPLGLRGDDRVVGMVCDSGGKALSMEGVSFESLKEIVQDRGGKGVIVVFERPSEVHGIEIVKHSSAIRSSIVGCFFLVLLMFWGVMSDRGVRLQGEERRLYITLILSFLFGTFALSVFVFGSKLYGVPILSFISFLGLGLYRASSFEYHVRLRGLKRVFDKFSTISLYLAPMVFLVQAFYFSLRMLPMYMGREVSVQLEMRLDTMYLLLCVVYFVYVCLDFILMLHHRLGMYRKEGYFKKIRSFELGLVLSFLFSCLGIYYVLVQSSALMSGIFLGISVGVQMFGDFGILLERGAKALACGDTVFSARELGELLRKTESMLGEMWRLEVVVDRPLPYGAMCVLSDKEGVSLSGLCVKSCDPMVRDFLEVLRTEGGMVPRVRGDESVSDPVMGMADGLGIGVAWPLMDGCAGSLSSIVILLYYEGDMLLSRSASQEGVHVIQMVLSEYMNASLSFVYHSAEAATRGYNVDRTMLSESGEESVLERDFALDSEVEAVDDENIKCESTGLKAEALFEHEEDGRSVSVADLQDQLRALHAQQSRRYLLQELELSDDQLEVVEDIVALGTPMLLLGERSVGKHLVSMIAHDQMGGGPFFEVDASFVPESVLRLELFGEQQEGDEVLGGLLRHCVGGSLYVGGANHLSVEMLQSILDSADSLEGYGEGGIRLFFGVDVDFGHIDWEQLKSDPQLCPSQYKSLAEKCDAEMVMLKPVRNQNDVVRIAEYFMHKEAMRLSKQVVSLSEGALDAISLYNWPGNFKELQAVISRAVMIVEGSEIGIFELGLDKVGVGAQNQFVSGDESFGYEQQIHQLQELTTLQRSEIEQLQMQVESLSGEYQFHSTDENVSFEGSYQEIEHRLFRYILKKYDGDKGRAIEQLGISRTAFLSKLGKYDLE